MSTHIYGTPEERFWPKVNKTDTCWEWLAGKHPKGYGQFAISGVPIRAHRFSYELHKGPIPEGLMVLHSCDNPSCVNPDHLSLGTHQDNMDDRTTKGRHHESQKTHCPRGHPYDEAHTYISKDGSKLCRECIRIRQRALGPAKRLREKLKRKEAVHV